MKFVTQCSHLDPYLGTQILQETHIQNWVPIGSLFSLDIPNIFKSNHINAKISMKLKTTLIFFYKNKVYKNV